MLGINRNSLDLGNLLTHIGRRRLQEAPIMKSGLRPRLSRCVALSIDADAARTRA